ncbi:MAG: hypothetical protein H6736_20895 [Alphaproteobacteria bacterium]|nr:hypothetical protein [Alphaproteobacteria bacterium]MCB9694275.1 hypothetical protein [Alphaproteobacteria bacterium]
MDLDLHVLTPADEEIWYAEPVDSSGGSLDVDCYCGSCEQGGNENVFWDYTGARPPAGAYTVGVFYYGYCQELDPPPVSTYTLRILESGREVFAETGELGPDGSTVHDHTWGG